MEDIRIEFLEKLQLRKSEIEEALRHLMAIQREHRAAGDPLNDESDQGQHAAAMSSRYGLIEHKTRELRDVEGLLRRISSDGCFGLCEECDEPIPPARLMIVPEATLCVPCQGDREKSVRHRRAPRPAPIHGSAKEPEWEENGGLYDVEFEWLDQETEPLPQFRAEARDS